jgi:hypothetical protein
MLFDFIVFSNLLLKNKQLKQKIILNILILFSAIALYSTIQLNLLNHQTRSLFYLAYALVLGIISITIFWGLSKNHETPAVSNACHFWILRKLLL